jgi:hypothetical protein
MRIAAILALLCLATSACAEVSLIARASVPGTAVDRSGQKRLLEDGVPANRLGGFGSAIAWTGRGQRFVMLSDRGPNAVRYNAAIDNTTSYDNRFHVFDLKLTPQRGEGLPPFRLTPRLRVTRLLHSAAPLARGPLPSSNRFTGRSDAFDPSRPSSWPNHARLDPEGARVSLDRRSLFVADEYGPVIYRFSLASGRRTAVYELPEYYAVAKQDPVGRTETRANTRGRVANRSMEGLAITPDGRTLAGLMQNPLIQDGGVGALPARILTVDLASQARHEYVYRLEDGDNLLSEMVAVNERQFLVVERDGLEGAKAAFKRLYLADLAGATDVAGQETLPREGVQAVKKTLFLDLLDPRLGLAGRSFPPRIEGLAFGPDVVVAGRRRHTLYVTSDNDYEGDEPSEILVFALDDEDLPGFKPQRFRR